MYVCVYLCVCTHAFLQPNYCRLHSTSQHGWLLCYTSSQQPLYPPEERLPTALCIWMTQIYLLIKPQASVSLLTAWVLLFSCCPWRLHCWRMKIYALPDHISGSHLRITSPITSPYRIARIGGRLSLVLGAQGRSESLTACMTVFYLILNTRLDYCCGFCFHVGQRSCCMLSTWCSNPWQVEGTF